ncbi:Hpt domain-containing protein [Paenarthrobacter sp. 22069]|uniref:Hpt domain-containing protein n=1 Tax=Paenarthrobacter sp. 22069 TaxID=3453864 RepID=UPI003F831DBC
MTEGRALFDPQVIHTLALNLGNKALAFRFLSDYLTLLPRRKIRIIDAIRDDDPEAAMDAILSLKIASSMVGAHDAEDRSLVLQSLVAKGHLEQSRPEATALGAAIDALVIEGPGILAALQPHLSG